jgi:DNA polymerase (family 10)
MAELLSVKGEIRFKIQAYQKAARAVAENPRPLAEIHAEGGPKALMTIPGIGEGLARKISELLATGRCAAYEALKASLPAGISELLGVPHLGPRTALTLSRVLGISSVDELEKALKAGRLRGLPRMGEKLEGKLLRGIALWRQGRERMPLGVALPRARALVAALRSLPGTKRAEYAGSLRRMCETVGDLDFMVSPKSSGDAPGILKAFVSLPGIAEVVASGATKASIRFKDGFEADLRVVEDGSFGAALHYFTGSKTHNIRIRELGVRKGLKISEYGIFKGMKRTGGGREEDVFRAVGLPFVPPELREGAGELEAAAADRLPRLVTEENLRGDLHVHSRYSDGENGLEDLARTARKMGYAYLAVSDHSPSLKIARGLPVTELRRKNREIDRINGKIPGFRLLKAAEVDILGDGTLDYPDDVLSELDVVIVSVHTRFNLDSAAQTRRITRALAHPRAMILGHPTGRLFGQREPYPVDLAAVLRAARDHGKAVELNGSPDRLDLSSAHLRQAKDLGVPVAVNSDAHTLEQLIGYRELGIGTARRGWLEADDVLNTLPLGRLLKKLRH